MDNMIGIILLALIIFISYWVIQWIRLPNYLEKISYELKRIADNLEKDNK